MAYTYFTTSTSGDCSPLIYFKTSRLGCLIFHGYILTFPASPSMQCITFIKALTALPTNILLLLFFVMDTVTMYYLIVWVLVPHWPILSETSEDLSRAMRWDRMQNELWFGSTTAFWNIIFFRSSDFILARLELLTWGVDYSAVSL